MILLAFICGTLWLIWWVYAVFAYRSRCLAGTTVVVTGACSEVGRRLCIQLYAHGARVLAWDYSRIKLQELQAEVQRIAVSESTASVNNSSSSNSDDGRFIISAVDVSSRMQVQRAAKEVEGPIDMLINAAHTYPVKSLHDRADDSVDRVFQTNLVSPLLVVRQLLPSLFATEDATTMTTTTAAAAAATSKHAHRRGDYAQVVNIVCGASNYAVSAHAPDYAASQWGMVGLHYSMRAWIAQERAAAAAARTQTAKSNSEKGDDAWSGNLHVVHHPREVRTTLLCLNDIQNGVPTVLSSILASSPNTLASPKTPGQEDAAGAARSSSGSRASNAVTTASESYTSTLLRRNAELDRAVACCMAAIRRGQERYCYASSWRTTVLLPLAMLCPLPWAERLLSWLQYSSNSTTVR